MRLLLLAPLLLASPSLAGELPPSATELPAPEVPAAIVNGEPEPGWDAVVALGADFGNPFSVCTGAFITERVVLTAAHCGAELPVEVIEQIGQVFVGPDVDNLQAQYRIIQYTGHPGYEPLTNGPNGQLPRNDVGVALIEGSSEVEPFFINLRELDRDDEGTALLSVGYGTDSGEGGGGGTKRRAEVVALAFDEDFIISVNGENPNNANICSGDSGGPMFEEQDEGPAVIWGVHSWGDPDCAVRSGSTRTDLMGEWILDQVEAVHGSRDLCEINGWYEDGECSAFCPLDPECEEPTPAPAADDDDDGGVACQGCAAELSPSRGPGSLFAALLLLGLPLRRRRSPPLRPLLVASLLLAALLPTAALAAKPTLPTLSADEMEKVRAGKIVLKKTDEGGATTVNAVVELGAKPELLWPILFSVDHIKASTGSIKSLVATRDVTAPNGDRQIDLSYVLKVGWTEIAYSVKRSYVAADGTMTWELDKAKQNDIEWTEGSYSVYPGSAEGRTLFLYRARIETGKNIPEWLEEDLTESSLKRYLRYLMEQAEQ